MTRSAQALTTGLLLAVLIAAVPLARAAEVTPEAIYEGHRLVEDWRIQEADAYAQKLMKANPKSGDVHFLQARVEFFKGNYDYAWKLLKRVDSTRDVVREFKSLVNETRQAAQPFVTRESEHFIFKFVKGPDEILVHYAEEALEASYQVLGELLDYYPEEKVRVEIYPDREPLSQVSPLTRKDIITSGTVALCKYNRLMLISPASLVRGYNWLDTLSHEYIHYLLTKKSRNNLPLWMHEGIAKYFENRWRKGRDFLTPLMETVLGTGLKNDYLISLDSMMPSLAKLKTQEDVQLAYAEVASMIDFLVELRGQETLPLLLSDLAAGQEFESSLQHRLGMDLDTFQTQWKESVRAKKLKTIPGLKTLEKRFKKARGMDEDKKAYREVGKSRSQDLTFLGDILKSRNEFKAAIVEYEKAFKESEERSPILYNKLAGTYMILKDNERAESYLKTTLEHYPDFHTTLVNLAELYFTTGQHKKALTYFQRAVRINPFNPFVHIRLIDLYEALDMPEEKKLQESLYKFIE